jgi:hypothetical protein
MTRRAVEEHLEPAPEITLADDDPASDAHPYNTGCQVFYSGAGIIYVDITTGLFWKDLRRTLPASDDEARRCGVDVRQWHHKRRALKLRQDTEDHIARLTQRQAEPAKEDLKARVRHLVREEQKKVQAAADRALTRHLDSEPPAG